jgi:death on curing protein
MRYLTISEVLDIHEKLLQQSGGAKGIRDLGALESAISQPFMQFGGNDLYPDLISKASALCFSLVMNHPFIDGNKRVGHAAMEIFLVLNNREIIADVEEQEEVMFNLAAGKLNRDNFSAWLKNHIRKLI